MLTDSAIHSKPRKSIKTSIKNKQSLTISFVQYTSLFAPFFSINHIQMALNLIYTCWNVEVLSTVVQTWLTPPVHFNRHISPLKNGNSYYIGSPFKLAYNCLSRVCGYVLGFKSIMRIFSVQIVFLYPSNMSFSLNFSMYQWLFGQHVY